MDTHARQPSLAAATLCACALIAGLLLGDGVGAFRETLPLWAGGSGALSGLWAGLRALRRGARRADRLTESLLLSGLLMAGAARGAQCARVAETQLALGAACQGLAWVAGQLGVEGGRPILAARAARPVGEGQMRMLPATLRIALPRTPHETLRHAARGAGGFEGFVWLRPPRGPSGPGATDERALLRASRLGAAGTPVLGHLWPRAPAPGWLARIGRDFCSPGSGAEVGLQLRGGIARAIGGEPGAFAACFLFGQAGGAQVPPAYGFALWRCGASHVLAVSGLHVGMVAALIHVLLGTLPLRPRTRWLGLAIALALYAAAVGPSVSVARAATIGALYALLRAAGRLPRGRTLLLVVGAAWLWATPGAARLPGWRLTYIVSLSLIGIATGSGARGGGGCRRPTRGSAIGRALAGGATAIVAAQGAAWPLVLGHYGWASPFFLLSNAVLIPLCGLLMPLLWVALVPLVTPGFPADLAAVPASLAIRIFVALAGLLGRLCDACVIGCGPPQAVALATSLAVAIVCNTTRCRRGVRLAVAVILAGAFTVGALVHEPQTRMLALDVGQGECWVLAWRQETWVIDTGPEPATAGRARWALARALRRLGRTRIDRLLLTHTDTDHIGGLQEILAAGVRVRVLHHPQGWRPQGRLAQALRALEGQGTRLQPLAAGDVVDARDARAAVIHPPAGALEAGAGANEASLAVRLEVNDFSVLLSGDVPAQEQLTWVRAGMRLEARVLSGAHHGSRSSTPVELLKATKARLLVISAGRGNRFGHPHAEVLQRAADCGLAVRRTDRDGSILLGRGRRGWAARSWVDGRLLTL